MPSHLTPADERPPDVTEMDLKGNFFADKYAGDMAGWVTLPLDVASPVLHNYNLIKLIQRRLATIVTYLPNRPKHKKPKPVTQPKPCIEAAILASPHTAYRHESRIKCPRCLNSFNSKDPNVFHFLKSSCQAIGSVKDRPTPLQKESPHLGNKLAHHTHELMCYRSIIYCNRCGMLGVSEFHSLSKPCTPPLQIWNSRQKSLK